VKCAIGALASGIHVLIRRESKDVDGRDKPGHDARHLRIFAVVSSIFGRVEETPAMFHSKCFTPNKLDFRDLENCMSEFVDRA
jgi:hypothetical protein